MKKINDNLGCFVLAGGEGSRLGNLTKHRCKPLIKVCSHYHLIDFSLINCLRSNISNIAVIVQYEAIDLIKYLFESNLNSLMTNFNVLPPETKKANTEDILYKNTAHSVMVNMEYVDNEDIEDILILSADHVYAMDYDIFYNHHLEMENDLTVSVLNVSIDEAKRFGVFTLDDDDNIINFQEKPENPESTLVSMGVYIFNKEKLMESFDVLSEKIGPDLDFGKHVLPYFLEHYKVGVYKFKWYWLDLGTINAFWKLNMDILDSPNYIKDFFEFDKRFKIENEARDSSPTFLCNNSIVNASVIGKNSFIEGNIYHSVIGDNVFVEKGVNISNSVVMDNCKIKKGTTIENVIISQDTIVEEDIIADEDNIICK